MSGSPYLLSSALNTHVRTTTHSSFALNVPLNLLSWDTVEKFISTTGLMDLIDRKTAWTVTCGIGSWLAI